MTKELNPTDAFVKLQEVLAKHPPTDFSGMSYTYTKTEESKIESLEAQVKELTVMLQKTVTLYEHARKEIDKQNDKIYELMQKQEELMYVIRDHNEVLNQPDPRMRFLEPRSYKKATKPPF